MGVLRIARLGALVVLTAALGAGTAHATTAPTPAWAAKISCAKLMPVSEFAAITLTPFKTLVQSYDAQDGYLNCSYRFPSAGAPGGQASEGWGIALLNAKAKALDAQNAVRLEKAISRRGTPSSDCQPGGYASAMSVCGILHPFGPKSWLGPCDIVVETAKYSVGAMFCADTPAGYVPPADPGQPGYEDAALLAWAHAVLPRLH